MRARVVGGHATVDWTVKQRFWTFQAIWENFEKSRWTVTREWLEVTRPSADCQTTFFRLFKQIENFLKKVAERSRESGRRSRDCRPTVKQRFFHVSSNLGKFEKSRWTVTRQWSEVTRPSADCQTTFYGRFKQNGRILKKVPERSRDSGWGHATVGRLSNNVFERFKQLEIFLKKSLDGHVTVVGGHATVGRLSNNVFWTFQAIWKNFEKVAERSRDSGWGHATVADCQTTFFGRFKRFGKILEKVAERSRRQWSEVTRPSADCQTTFFGRFKRFGKFRKSR